MADAAQGAPRVHRFALPAAALLVSCAYLLLPHGGVAEAAFIVVLALAAAASAAWAGFAMNGAARVCWLCLSAGMLLTAAGQAGQAGTPAVFGRSLPYPSWADALLLATTPLLAVALAAIGVVRRHADPLGDVLDALVIAVGGGGLLTAYVVVPALERGPSTPLPRLVTVLYPATDLVLLTLVVPVFVSHRLSRPLLLVGASFVGLLTGNSLHSVALTSHGPHHSHLADACWMASYLLLAVAPVGSRPDELAPEPLKAEQHITNGRWALLAGALLAGPILLVHRGTPALGVAVSALMLPLVVARMAHLNKRLARASEDVRTKNDELKHQAMHDALTGLPNRTLITDRIEWMLTRIRTPESACAALLVDLDGFKHVNDSRGHEVGDRLLQAVARRLTRALREVDSIGRVGGDEFAVLIDEIELTCAPELVAARIIDVLRQPFDLGDGGAPVTITATIGVAVASSETPSDLLRDADVALNQAKASGRNCYEVFAPEMETTIQRRYEIELDLRGALAGDQFELVYQPIYDLDELTLVGLEALLRWNHPVRGQIQPAEFVPVLESSGQIVEVGRWVLRTACRHMTAWHAAGSNLIVSVNVSPQQLDRDSLVTDVREALTETRLAPAALTVEVTETALMRNVQETARRLRELKRLGVQVAIDDFGTGYSSLAYLQQFPVDCLKIDRTFTDALSRSPESDALIHTLVQLGKDLGLRTLAEGVETPTQMARLRRENVNAVQGFLFARPMTVAAVGAELARRRTQAATPVGDV